MPERVTTTVRAESLPEEIRAKLRPRPIPGTRYRVTAEPVEDTEAEKLAALRAGLQKGLAEIDAGLGIEEDDAFRHLDAASGSDD